MRVAQTIASLDEVTGGPARSLGALCRQLAAAGVDVELFVADGSGPKPVPGTDEPLEARRLPSVRLGRWSLPTVSGYRRAISPVLSGEGDGLLHDNGLWLPSNRAAVLAGRSLGLPVVISPRGMLEPWAFSHHSLRKRIAWLGYQRRVLLCARVLHATSQTEAATIHGYGLGLPVAVIPHGVHVPPAPVPPRGAVARTALFLGRLHPVKGLAELLAAWAAVRPEGWELALAGPDEGGYRGELEALCSSLGLAGMVRFSGPVGDREKWNLYGSASLFVSPSFNENFGLTIAEALAAGRPVLTSTATPWGTVQAKGCGWVVAPSAEAVAGALREATSLGDDVLLEMGARGRAWVAAEYSWETTATRMMELYEWLLGRREMPATVRPGRAA